MADSLFVKLLSVPKSIYVSGRLMGLKYAFRMPVFVRYNCVLTDLSGKVEMGSNVIRSRMLSIGFSCTGIGDKRYSRSVLQISGRLFVGGVANLGQGTKLSIASTGTMILGDKFSSTYEGSFICVNRISIGEGTAIGWNALIMDTDWHSIIDTVTGEKYPAAGTVDIGKNCWICAHSMVLKNAVIPDGCILAANSTATKIYATPNTLLAGSPAIVKKFNVTRLT